MEQVKVLGKAGAALDLNSTADGELRTQSVPATPAGVDILIENA